MTYPMTNWVDEPAETTPFTSANMLLYNAAINDLDDRVSQSQPVMTVIGVQSAGYTALINEFIPVSTLSGSVTITLPSAPADGSRIGVKQIARVPPNVVTIQAGGADTFNTVTGPTAVTLSGLNQSSTYQYVAATGVWISIAADVPLAESTARAIGMSMVLGAFCP